ncbi:uncharacterized protein BT62DRAFT_1080873 [Guyanagaster necrorhizus]|uniref:O-methyltransferase C-terminal domain-containing protein n=1 Tax=Guyanagaster necrorhizus TaxID=856835 RepID=A0A9P7VHB3_9AGAR|nr:uncharacterized protein BT62DRAFT_1080873 [Guyanagaster necrorhizus MCA 3950]KAG7440370.1 hypothetical protein BT62DRAFT_1080873 [Guyanagaster necrorhizus MCA 3950]
MLQDVPAQIEMAKTEVLPKVCPVAIGEGHLDFKAMDFFSESPVKDCDVYFVTEKYLHNWTDEECKTILTSLVNAMSSNSHLLINDYIIQHVNRDRNTSESALGLRLAPEPLFPHYGAGRMTRYSTDLDMTFTYNSQECTLEHFIELGQGVGLNEGAPTLGPSEGYANNMIRAYV